MTPAAQECPELRQTSELLEAIIRAVCEKIDPDPNSMSAKYGAEYVDEKFSIHRFCWCDEETCPWCGPADRPQFRHDPTGLEVWWYKYIGRGMKFSRTPTLQECEEILRDVLSIPPSSNPKVG